LNRAQEDSTSVIPAKERHPGVLESGAGIQETADAWTPACAGVTRKVDDLLSRQVDGLTTIAKRVTMDAKCRVIPAEAGIQ
jgi:hypothetical protein